MKIVLIDDDKLIRISWRNKAAKTNTHLTSFASVEEFLRQSSSLSTDSSIYIDSDLGCGVKGEYESKKLFELGFTNIYLATGYTDLKLEDYPWLKGIVSKSPPF